LIFTLGVIQFRASADAYFDNSPKTDISTDKEWVVKFNSPLNPATVNNKNIVVTDEDNNTVPVSISPGSSADLIVVYPAVSGYNPGEKYNLVIGTDVQSSAGKKLAKAVSIQFTTSKKYIDCTSYENLPEITALKFEYTPLLPTQKQGFFISATNADGAQYRVFVHSYADDKDVYKELTNGYTTLTNGKITSLKTLEANTNGQKYKVIVYSRRQNVQGAHKDINTDYDNYYVDYMRCVNSVDSDSADTITKYNVSLDQMVDIQFKSTDTAVFVETNKFDNSASRNQIK
jgi:hypothetical protein